DLPGPLRERPRGGVAAESEWEECASGERLGGLEPRLPERPSEVEDRLAAALGERVEDHARDRLDGGAGGGGVDRAVTALIEHEGGVPGAVEGEVAAADDDAVEQRAVVRSAVADRPELRMEQGVLARGFDLVQGSLEEGVDATVRGGDMDPGGLAEHGGPAHEALDGVEQLRGI